MRTSGFDIGWSLVFEIVFSVEMVLIAPVGYPLGYSINIFLGLVIDNYFGTWEGSLVVVSLGALAGLVVVTGEGYFFVLSLLLPREYPFYSPNPGAELPGTLMGYTLGLFFGYEAVVCLCSCLRLMDFHKATCWGVGISCVPPSGYFITSKESSVRYFQLLDLITLSVFTTWLITTSGGR